MDVFQHCHRSTVTSLHYSFLKFNFENMHAQNLCIIFYSYLLSWYYNFTDRGHSEEGHYSPQSIKGSERQLQSDHFCSFTFFQVQI